MSEVFQFFKDFGNLVNTVLLASLIGIGFQVFRVAIKQKDAQIDLLRERISATEAYSVDNVAPKFRALKEYYESHLKDWLHASMKVLEEERRKAIEDKEREFQLNIEEEMEKRNKLVNELMRPENDETQLRRRVPEAHVCGDYSVTGYNPDSPEHNYFGTLHIQRRGLALSAKWAIGAGRQAHDGVGFLSGNALAFAFRYLDSHKVLRSGIIVYDFMGIDVMRGTWTGFEESRIGFEECRRIGS